MPTYAGHDEIWCGGQGVTILPQTSVIVQGAVAEIVVSYSLDELTFKSSACSFQGSEKLPLRENKVPCLTLLYC